MVLPIITPFQSLRPETTLRRPAMVLLVLLTVIILGDVALASAFGSISTSGVPGGLPQVGTAGETVLFYTRPMGFLKYVLVPLTALWLAHAYGRSRASTPAGQAGSANG